MVRVHHLERKKPAIVVIASERCLRAKQSPPWPTSEIASPGPSFLGLNLR
jgi:hypothetical protein